MFNPFEASYDKLFPRENNSRSGYTVKLRRGPENKLESFVPLEGELILETTNNLLYVGDGVTPGFIMEDHKDLL